MCACTCAVQAAETKLREASRAAWAVEAEQQASHATALAQLQHQQVEHVTALQQQLSDAQSQHAEELQRREAAIKTAAMDSLSAQAELEQRVHSGDALVATLREEVAVASKWEAQHDIVAQESERVARELDRVQAQYVSELATQQRQLTQRAATEVEEERQQAATRAAAAATTADNLRLRQQQQLKAAQEAAAQQITVAAEAKASAVASAGQLETAVSRHAAAESAWGRQHADGQREREGLTRQLETAKATALALEAEAAQQRRESEGTLADVRGELQRIEAARDAAEEAVGGLRSQLGRVSEELESATATRRSMKQQLQSATAQVKTFQQELAAHAESEVQAEASFRSQLAAQHTQHEKTTAALTAALEAAQAQLVAQEAVQTSINAEAATASREAVQAAQRAATAAAEEQHAEQRQLDEARAARQAEAASEEHAVAVAQLQERLRSVEGELTASTSECKQQQEQAVVRSLSRPFLLLFLWRSLVLCMCAPPPDCLSTSLTRKAYRPG
eukprot:COSAG05_NODE_238_length_13155_cov_489.969899_5_plen_509_part_00